MRLYRLALRSIPRVRTIPGHRRCHRCALLVTLSLVFVVMPLVTPAAQAATSVCADPENPKINESLAKKECNDRGWLYFEKKKHYRRWRDATIAADENLSEQWERYGDPAESVHDLREAGFYVTIPECSGIAMTRPGATENALTDVYIARSVELPFQIAYDILSNEITGVAGAISGALLNVFGTVPRFAVEWVYDINDECQEIVHRNTVLQIKDQLDTHGAQLAAIETTLSDHGDALAATELMFIEDHLDTCRPLVSLTLPAANSGRLDLSITFVESLAVSAAAAGISIEQAEQHIDSAKSHRAEGEYSRSFRALCKAYDHLASPILPDQEP